ncbi:hypothetical protein [Mycobacteroides abscessus]|uniref:hypothetical protein n=1 Tax=Mycobacteroides abscessus TaxID=36809 RepID=UPI0003740960|nr:hypothetical protein [Mycobacteroides abscessus]
MAEHQPPATVPVMARRRWLVVLARWVESPEGLAALKKARVRPQTLLAVAEAIARQSTGSTGRNIAVTNRRLAAAADRSEATVTRVRKVLLSQGFLYRSAEGVSAGRGCNARPAIDHLTARRELCVVSSMRQRRKPARESSDHLRVKNAAAQGASSDVKPVDNDLAGRPRGTKMPSLSVVNPVENKSLVTFVVDNQSAGAWSTKASNSGKPAAERRRWWLSYAMADVLVDRLHGIDGGARSAVASALFRSHLDLEAWQAEGGGATVVRALSVHAPTSTAPVETGGAQSVVHRWDWPSQIAAPGGFLAVRLRHLPSRPLTVSTPAAARTVVAAMQLGPGSTSTGRASARNLWKQAQADRAAAKRAAADLLAALPAGRCPGCRSLDAELRTELPVPVCHECWEGQRSSRATAVLAS